MIEKFVELFQVSIEYNSRLVDEHPFKSNPQSWPLMLRGISFWDKSQNQQRIYLLGNIVCWWISISSVFIYTALLLLDRLAERRGIKLFNAESLQVLHKKGSIFYLAWIAHYIPFFFMQRSLYLHHYLPSLIFSFLVAATVYEFISCYVKKLAMKALLGAFLSSAVYVYWVFSPLVYGLSSDVPQWISSWDFSK